MVPGRWFANDKAMSMGKATELEVAGNGKFP
jgi:hypothetical protein